jgi:polysaccharide pyruvyl transferase WcaK-like protein
MKRILHLASFEGNIGDIWSHMGLYTLLENMNCVIDKLEIRKMYSNYEGDDKLESNQLVAIINSYDMCIIGGGNFLELKWPYSISGTTLNFGLDKISKPISIISVGFDKYKYKSNELDQKFLGWLKSGKNINLKISLRNDGSTNQLNNILNKENEFGFINSGLDNAFLLPASPLKKVKKRLGINVVEDMSDIRFVSVEQQARFYESVGELCNFYLNNGWEIRFIPHIPSDLMAIINVVKYFSSKHSRSKLWSVASLENSTKTADKIWDEYAQCERVLAMRFHANIAAIINECDVCAINSYDKIRDLFNEVDRDFDTYSVEEIVSHIKMPEMIKFRHVDSNPAKIKEYKAYLNNVFASE